MTYSPSGHLKLYLIDNLTEENTWADLTNTNLSRLEQAIHGICGKTISGLDVTLDDTSYTGTESHKKCLLFQGSMAASCSVIVPDKQRLYWVWNLTTGAGGNAYTITVRPAAGTGPALAHGERALVYSDGLNCYPILRSAEFLSAYSGGAVGGQLNMAGNKIVNLGAPTDAGDAATKNYVDGSFAVSLFNVVYPVGSIYLNVNNVNPGTYYGVGTWVAYGHGRMLVGVGNTTDDRGENRTINQYQVGGEFSHVLTVPELPPHNHAYTTVTHLAGTNSGGGDSAHGMAATGTGVAGSGNAHNNMPPYVAVYMWLRTA